MTSLADSHSVPGCKVEIYLSSMELNVYLLAYDVLRHGVISD